MKCRISAEQRIAELEAENKRLKERIRAGVWKVGEKNKRISELESAINEIRDISGIGGNAARINKIARDAMERKNDE